MRYAVLVCGPAGSGKSTFTSALITHAQTLDIRDLISLEDVMEELEFGPNGGLVYCFEYLLNNLDWLQENLNSYDEDYLVIDCPGQIELYTHFNIIQKIVQVLAGQFDFRLCATYLLESNFISDRPKFFSGGRSSSSAGIGQIGPKELERYLDPDPDLLVDEVNSKTNVKFHNLNQAISQLIQDFNMVSFLPLDVTDEESLGTILSHIDNSMQYGEHEEPKEPKDLEGDGFEAEEADSN
ncbi:GPN-loop GTPase [Melampsora americana]|nr:GPN-loop GTPase [Melampsora americana]